MRKFGKIPMNAICLKTTNDTYGNPRSVYVIFSEEGEIIDTIDEGHEGVNTLLSAYPELRGKYVHTFDTTVKEYNRLTRLHLED